MNEFILHVFGDYSIIEIFSFSWFFIVGYVIYGLTEATGRDVKSKNTPQIWSWKFWFKDNWKRYLVTILSTYIMFRFYIELSGHDFSDFEALMLGLIGDGIGKTMKDRVKMVSANRIALMEEHNKIEDEI